LVETLFRVREPIQKVPVSTTGQKRAYKGDLKPLAALDSPEALAQAAASAILTPLVQVGEKVARDKRVLLKDGVQYVPLALAAWLAQTSETTLRTWIDKKAKFDKKVIQTYISPATTEIYIGQESLAKIAERFVKHPSNDPAGPVTIGETKDSNGYLGLPDAARSLGISSRTMWLWATQGKAPIQKDLDVIKCTTSDHFYINERDVRLLQKLERPKGLRRGPKPRSVSHP